MYSYEYMYSYECTFTSSEIEVKVDDVRAVVVALSRAKLSGEVWLKERVR